MGREATDQVTPPTDKAMLQAAACLRAAGNVAVLTGAGVSAESGIPTFRDALSGLWARYDPSDLATAGAFARNPELVSRWYDQRRCQVAMCRPNAGHVALARLQQTMVCQGRGFTLITQNVDRLHQSAGSRQVIELHGSLWRWRCVRCDRQTEERGPAFERYPPLCPCGGMKRPGVVWFGEPLPAAAISAAQEAARRCDLLLSIGTSSTVYPAAALVEQALAAGAKVLEINPATTPHTAMVTWSLRGGSGEILPTLVAELDGQ